MPHTLPPPPRGSAQTPRLACITCPHLPASHPLGRHERLAQHAGHGPHLLGLHERLAPHALRVHTLPLLTS
eukprot:208442-Chlamydomonas_euryale.AAC.4